MATVCSRVEVRSSYLFRGISISSTIERFDRFLLGNESTFIWIFRVSNLDLVELFNLRAFTRSFNSVDTFIDFLDSLYKMVRNFQVRMIKGLACGRDSRFGKDLLDVLADVDGVDGLQNLLGCVESVWEGWQLNFRRDTVESGLRRYRCVKDIRVVEQVRFIDFRLECALRVVACVRKLRNRVSFIVGCLKKHFV